MNVTLLKAVVALLPACLLLLWTISRFRGATMVPSVLLVLGAGCVVVVVLTHVCEALHWLPRMRWGEANSVGHYLDLSGAVLGATLLPVGYVLQAISKRRT